IQYTWSWFDDARGVLHSYTSAPFVQNPIPTAGPDPTAHFGMDDFHWRNFMRGYNVALNRLSDSNCLRAISALAGDLAYSAKSVLQGIFQRHGFSYGGANAAIARTSRGLFSDASS